MAEATREPASVNGNIRATTFGSTGGTGCRGYRTSDDRYADSDSNCRASLRARAETSGETRRFLAAEKGTFTPDLVELLHDGTRRDPLEKRIGHSIRIGR